jgi:hypothetical protein
MRKIRCLAAVAGTLAALAATCLTVTPAQALATQAATCNTYRNTITWRAAVSVDYFENDSTHWYNYAPRYRVSVANGPVTSDNNVSMYVHDYSQNKDGLSRAVTNVRSDGALHDFAGGEHFITRKGQARVVLRQAALNYRDTGQTCSGLSYAY